jgi:hypothetical protein
MNNGQRYPAQYAVFASAVARQSLSLKDLLPDERT